MAAPSKYSEAELELIGLMAHEVKRLKAEQRTRVLTLGEMEVIALIALTAGELQATHGRVK